MTRVAINGLGRIGRATLKIIMETPEFELVAVNDIATLENIAYLIQYDSVYGVYSKPVETRDGKLIVDSREIQYLSERQPPGVNSRSILYLNAPVCSPNVKMRKNTFSPVPGRLS